MGREVAGGGRAVGWWGGGVVSFLLLLGNPFPCLAGWRIIAWGAHDLR